MNTQDYIALEIRYGATNSKPFDREIRLATVDDSDALAHIQVDSYRSAYAGILADDYLTHFTYEEQAADWRNLLQSATDDILLVAEAKGIGIIGYALSRPGQTEIPPFDSEIGYSSDSEIKTWKQSIQEQM